MPWEDGSGWDPWGPEQLKADQLRVDGGMCQSWRADYRNADSGGNGCNSSAHEEAEMNRP